MARGISVLAFALSVALAGPAPAPAQGPRPQPQTGGHSGMSTATVAENVNAYRELSAFGACYARSSRTNALAFIATEPGSREESAFFERYIGGERYSCGGAGWTNASMTYWRGVIAEGLLRSGGVPATHVLPVPTVEQVRDLDDIGRWYAAGHQAQVRELLATRLGSPDEVAAVAALWNDFRTCMPASARVRLNAPWIRFLLAEGLLRMAPDTTLAGS